MEIWPGEPFQLGATYDGSGTNFAVFSRVAHFVELCRFDERGDERRVALPGRTSEVWHGYLPNACHWLGSSPDHALRRPGPRDPRPPVRSAVGELVRGLLPSRLLAPGVMSRPDVP